MEINKQHKHSKHIKHKVRTNTFLPLTKTSVLQTRWKEDAGTKILKHHVLLRPQRASLAIRRKQKMEQKIKETGKKKKKYTALRVSGSAAKSRKRFFVFVFVEVKKL